VSEHLVERRPADACARRRAHGVFHLLPRAGAGGVHELPAEGLAVLVEVAGEPHLRTDGPWHDPAAVVLEPLARNELELLLALRGPAAELEVNGCAAPRAAVLRPGDELRLGASPALRVDFFRASPFVLADEEHAHAHCQLCRGAIRAGGRVYVCPCGALAHADEPHGASPEAEPLECAFGTCTSCGRAIVPEAGYVGGGPDAC
jgi:hypothetical protein